MTDSNHQWHITISYQSYGLGEEGFQEKVHLIEDTLKETSEGVQLIVDAQRHTITLGFTQEASEWFEAYRSCKTAARGVLFSTGAASRFEQSDYKVEPAAA